MAGWMSRLRALKKWGNNECIFQRSFCLYFYFVFLRSFFQHINFFLFPSGRNSRLYNIIFDDRIYWICMVEMSLKIKAGKQR